MSMLSRVAGCLLASLLLAVAGGAQAQTRVEEQQQRRVDQPGNNAPVWREVRSGNEGYTSLQGREMGVLVQSGGETWRQIRNGPVTFYGGWLLVVVFLAIAAFYAVKGGLKLHDKPTGRKIERFSGFERVTHWTVAITFVALAVTGLIMLFGKYLLLPVIGYTLFAWLTALGKNLHNFISPLFIVSLLVMIVLFIRDNWPKGYDWKWFAKAGGLFTGAHVPSGRFNAGEKGWFWVGVVALGIVVSVSGLVLLFPNFDQTRATMQFYWVWHVSASIIFMALSLGHIYMGTLGVEGSYDSMRHGHVDETWAREHHEYWYNEVKGGARSAPGGAVPAGAPHMREKA